MKITIIGGSGLIGSKLCHLLRERGHQPLAASPSSGKPIRASALPYSIIQATRFFELVRGRLGPCTTC